MLPEAEYVGMSNSASFGMFPRSLTPPHDDPSCGYFDRTPEGKCTLRLCVDIPPTMLMHSNSPSTPPIFKSVSLGHTNPNTPHRDFAFESDGGLLVAPTNSGGGEVRTPVTFQRRRRLPLDGPRPRFLTSLERRQGTVLPNFTLAWLVWTCPGPGGSSW